MPAPAENLQETPMDDRIAAAVLEREVVHLDKGLSEVKTELKELRSEMSTKFDATKAESKELRSEMNTKFDAAKAELKELRSEMNTKFDAAKTELKELRSETHRKFDETKVELKELRAEMNRKFEEFKDSLASAKIWALILYIGMGVGLLSLIAKTFRWIE